MTDTRSSSSAAGSSPSRARDPSTGFRPGQAGFRPGQAGLRPAPTGPLPEQWAPPAPGVGSISSTTVLVADPVRESRRLLATAQTQAGFGQIIGADSVTAVEDVIRAGNGGHLALISLAFGPVTNRLIDELRGASWLRIVALAPSADAGPMVCAVQAGASGVLRGHPGVPPTDPRQLNFELSTREIEVLGLVADGRSNKWIAQELALSALTVKSHLARISRKLGTGDRSHLVAIALRAGVLG